MYNTVNMTVLPPGPSVPQENNDKPFYLTERHWWRSERVPAEQSKSSGEGKLPGLLVQLSFLYNNHDTFLKALYLCAAAGGQPIHALADGSVQGDGGEGRRCWCSDKSCEESSGGFCCPLPPGSGEWILSATLTGANSIHRFIDSIWVVKVKGQGHGSLTNHVGIYPDFDQLSFGLKVKLIQFQWSNIRVTSYESGKKIMIIFLLIHFLLFDCIKHVVEHVIVAMLG